MLCVSLLKIVASSVVRYVFYSDSYVIYKVSSRLRGWSRVPVPLRAFHFVNQKTSTNVVRDLQKNILQSKSQFCREKVSF